MKLSILPNETTLLLWLEGDYLAICNTKDIILSPNTGDSWWQWIVSSTQQANNDLLLVPAARWESLSPARQSSLGGRPLLEGFHLHKTTIRV